MQDRATTPFLLISIPAAVIVVLCTNKRNKARQTVLDTELEEVCSPSQSRDTSTSNRTAMQTQQQSEFIRPTEYPNSAVDVCKRPAKTLKQLEKEHQNWEASNDWFAMKRMKANPYYYEPKYVIIREGNSTFFRKLQSAFHRAACHGKITLPTNMLQPN